MSQNGIILLKPKDATGAISTLSFSMNPHRARNGVFEYSGRQSVVDPLYYETGAPARIVASVRPGNPADFVTNKQRVKRRFTMTVELPISVPGVDGPIIDYIVTNVVVSAPVETTDLQVKNAIHMAYQAVDSSYAMHGQPLDDMLVYGNEPY